MGDKGRKDQNKQQKQKDKKKADIAKKKKANLEKDSPSIGR